jgi:cytochrome c-type biogenesis protein CcmF
MIFADVDITRGGKDLGRLSPARFIFTKGGQPTTEVSIMRGLRDDLYVLVGILDPQTKRATLRFHVNPFVTWVWVGVMVLVSGASLSLWPEIKLREVGAWGYVRLATGAATSILLSIVMATAPARASNAIVKDPQARVQVAASVDGGGSLERWPIAALITGLGAGAAAVVLTRKRRLAG